MVIKGTRIHTPNFAQKVDYILSDKGRAERLATFEICQNVRDHSRNGIINAFEENDRYRAQNAKEKKIKNSVVLYHDILSFHVADKDKISQYVLKDLVEYYIELRCPHAVVFAKPHMHNDNLHIHVLISGTNYRSSRVTRLSDSKWNSIRKEMERYQRSQYPELENSLVYDSIGDKKRKGKATRKENERQMRMRENTILDKDLMKKAVLDFFKVAKSTDDFYHLVKDHKIETYSRPIKGKETPYGVICNGRKMRFSTIGIDKEKFAELEQREQKASEYDANDAILKKYARYRRGNDPEKGRDRDIDRER
jgi:hypothetical protein